MTAESAPSRGETVLWRSVPDEAVSYCFAAHLVAADERHIALHQPHGAPTRRRTGARGGPRGSMLKGGWDGGHVERAWNGAASVRVHPVGSPYSVIRKWHPSTHTFESWYINLELPWRRSVIGYDSRDLVLDIVAEPDLSAWHWKDEEELEWAVAQGLLTRGQMAWIWGAGRVAAADLEVRTQVFDDSEWERWIPDAAWNAPAFGAGWADGAQVQTLPEATPR